MLSKKKKDEEAKPVEQEIAELQRKFRLLENDKRACSEDSQGVIRKQRATIEKLTRENRKMKTELKESRGNSGSQCENRMNLETIGHLSERREKLTAKLEAETEAAEALEATLSETGQHIFTLRGDMAKNGGVNASLDNAKAVQKQIRILENRLDKAAVRFNEAIAGNRELREQIDALRRERAVFDDIYKKLEQELSQKKREMANIIEQANSAYEARDQAQAQMASLKQQADREHLEFEREWKELGKLIANDKNMKDYMKNMVKQSKDKAGPAEGPDVSKRKTVRHAWDATAGAGLAGDGQEKVASFEEAFVRIQAATGIDNLEELVTNFIAAEDMNFTLFNYNNDLNGDIENLEQQIADYKEELVRLSGTGGKKEDTDKVKVLESLEERWNDIDKKATHYEVRCADSQQTLAHLRSGIDSLFRRIGCSANDLPSGSGTAISEANMMGYLAVVEGRTNELLKVYDAVREGEDDFEATRARPGNAAAALQVNKLPSTVEDVSDASDEDEDEDQRPFTVEELKAKMKSKAKKLAAQAKGKAKGRS